MPQYRKKPVVITAEQYTEYGKLVRGMCNSISCYTAGNDKPHVHTIHDNQIVILEVGDFVIPEPDGEHFYPCKPDIFANTYEALLSHAEAGGDRVFAEGFADALECVAQSKEGDANMLYDAAGEASRAGNRDTAIELRRVADDLRRERTLIDALCRYTEFHAYRTDAPKTISFVFASIADQMAAANAMDAVKPQARLAERIGGLLSGHAEAGGVEGDEPCDGGSHCCCCGPGEPCCDCGLVMLSKACIGEKCWCGAPAAKKVGEEIMFDDPMPARHNLTAYVCARHYAQMMGGLGAEQVGLAASPAAVAEGEA